MFFWAKVLHIRKILVYLQQLNKRSMNANIDISYDQLMLILQQMPVRSQLRIGRALTRKNIRAELNSFRETFRTDDISEEDILKEVKEVRRKRYAQKV